MIEVAIPTRARAETLCAKTLPLLLRLGVAPSSILIFAAPEEHGDYLTALGRTFPAPIVSKLRLEKGAVGVCANRNAITNHFDEGARYISIDDDLRNLMLLDGGVLWPLKPDEWEEIIETGFEMLDETGARLWGLYPVPNPYFMRRRISTKLHYIAGAVWGIVNRRDAHLVDLEYRDDWQRSVQCYAADGAVVRFDYVTWKTEGYHGAGGLQTDGKRTYESTLRDCEELVRRYPDLVTLNLTKKSGWPETRLRDRRPAVGQATLPT
jgi:hypothetical protein